MNRRDFIRLVLAAGGAGAIGGTNAMTKGSAAFGAEAVAHRTETIAPRAGTKPRPPARHRNLVVISLDGGNDGLTTAFPQRDPGVGQLRSLRRAVSIDPSQALPITAEWGVHPNLRGLHQRGVAIVAGVGVAKPDGSHFEMMRRWISGDPAPGTARLPGGFLGRLCDAVGDPDAPAVGVGVGSGNGQSLVAQKVSTLTLGYLGLAETFGSGGGDLDRIFRSGYEAMAGASSGEPPFEATPLGDEVRRGMRAAVRLGSLQAGEADNAERYPGSALGSSLRDAARILAAQVGVRVVQVSLGGFDTHQGHLGTHGALLIELDEALSAFLDDLAVRGLRDDTLVATVSEFGRRARDNGNDGLDHGAASVALLVGGPVRSGVYGTYPSLTRLDDDDNLVATVELTEYYASLASWMGVPPSDVLPGSPAAVATF